LQHAKRLCQQYEVHLVIDEIATGFGRTGTMFAHQHAGITPDFICLSKGLTGGTLPLSVVLTTDDVYAAFYDDDVSRGFLHSHSYTGNPLACRAALATLELFDELDILQRNVHTAGAIGKALQPLDAHPQLHHARHLGMIWAWDVKDAPPNFARTYAKHALKHGLLLRPIGSTLYTMPPYVMDDEAIAHLGKGMQLALTDALADASWVPYPISPDAPIRLA
jgi:adenosylmethionine-8-amino-7-oxononanoate aminotransferase